MRHTPASLLLFLLACGDKDEGPGTPAAPVDADGDGFDVDEDCDDGNEEINPDADEICDGIDNDCNGETDDDPVDMITVYTDADGDGYGVDGTGTEACGPGEGQAEEDGDCDDADADIHPDADELCDEIDNDCDDEIDDDPVDGDTWYHDDDNDGYGDPDDAQAACEQPDEHVADDSDCDDGESQISPHAAEIACDGIDNNCDGTVDQHTVPDTYATIEEAVSTAGSGVQICLQAGTYAETLDLSDAHVVLSGAEGAESTIIDLGGTEPFITATGDNTDISISGVTLSGLARTVADGETLEGQGIWQSGGSLSLEDVVISDVSVDLQGTTRVEGAVLHTEGVAVTLAGLSVTEAVFSATEDTAATGQDHVIQGGVLALWDGSLQASELTLDAASLTTDGADHDLDIAGLFLDITNDETSGAAALAGLSIADSTVTVDDGTSVDFDGFLRMSGASSSLELSGLDLRDNQVVIAATSATYLNGLVHLEVDALDGSDWLVEGNLGATSSASSSEVRGLVDVDVDTLWLSHVEGTKNALNASSTGSSGVASGTLRLVARSADVDHVDLRINNSSSSQADLSGGTVYLEVSDESWLSNFVLAGNSAGDTLTAQAMGAGLYIAASGVPLHLRNGDIVGNDATAETVSGGGIYWLDDDSGDGGSLINVNIVSNTVTASDVAGGGGLHIEDADNGGGPTVSTSNLYDNASPEVEGMDDPVGSDGNLAVDPLYTSASGDPTSWDLSLQSGSPAIDAGDADILDDDGTTSDIGAYGGPDGTSW